MIFIKKNMGGKVPENTFNILSIEVSAYIKRHTHNRINENDIPITVKFCTCSLIDRIKKLESKKGKTSESVGSWSVNYQDNSEDSKEMYDILVNYLLYEKNSEGKFLLYRGN